MSPPLLDGRGADAEGRRHLREGEVTGGAQASKSAGEAVGEADLLDQQPGEREAAAGAESALVQDLDDLGVGVLVEQLIDQGDHYRVGLPGLPGGQWERQGERARGSTAEADVGGEALAPEQGDVLHEQAQEPLPLAIRRARIAPQRGRSVARSRIAVRCSSASTCSAAARWRS